MTEFWSFIKTVVICGTVLVALFLILVSLRSELSAWLLRLYSMTLGTLTVLLLVYILNPLDIIPDLLDVTVSYHLLEESRRGRIVTKTRNRFTTRSIKRDFRYKSRNKDPGSRV